MAEGPDGDREGSTAVEAGGGAEAAGDRGAGGGAAARAACGGGGRAAAIGGPAVVGATSGRGGVGMLTTAAGDVAPTFCRLEGDARELNAGSSGR